MYTVIIEIESATSTYRPAATTTADAAEVARLRAWARENTPAGGTATVNVIPS